MSSSSNGLCRSVTGFLAADEFGHIQCHEHIWLRKGPSAACNPALCMDDYAKSLTELRNYRKAGGASIVDAQPGFFGRDAGVLQQLSAESGVNIFAVTGFHKLQFLESGTPLLRLSVSKMASLFASEIEQGMLLPGGDRSDARAGFIKIAYEGDGWNDPDYSRLFSAAAIAARETGAPVMVHTEKGNDVLGLIAWLRQNGVDPTRLLMFLPQGAAGFAAGLTFRPAVSARSPALPRRQAQLRGIVKNKDEQSKSPVYFRSV